MRILLVEDEVDFSQILSQQLRRFYVVDNVYQAREVQEKLRQIEYDLLILDINLPDMNGVNLCREIRRQEFTLPILMLTADGQVKTKVQALDWGADDYLTKPFELSELLARIRCLLRRQNQKISHESLKVADLNLQTNTRVVKRQEKKIDLRPKEFRLLEYLMRNQGQVITRDLILEHVWEKGMEVLSNTVDVHISFLRKKIDKPFSKRLIKTVYGLGYKIEE